MIFNHRTRKLTLHKPDRREISATYSLLQAIGNNEWSQQVEEAADALLSVMVKYGIQVDEHLQRPEKAEIAKARPLVPEDDGVTPPY